MSNPVIKYAGEHPVPVAIGVAVIGLALLFIMGVFKGGGGSSGNAGAAQAAFFSAQAAQAASGNALAIAQTNATAATAIAGIGANRDIAINQTTQETAADIAANNASQRFYRDQLYTNLLYLTKDSPTQFQALVNNGYYAAH